MIINSRLRYVLIVAWFTIMGYGLYNYLSQKTALNEQFFDTPLLFVLDENLILTDEGNRIGGNKYIELKFSKKVNENDIINILIKKGWVVESKHPLLLKKENILCRYDLNYITFKWK
jgi:hypothetical protein